MRKNKKSTRENDNSLRVELNREYNNILFTNMGRFRKSKDGEITLLIGNKKIKTNRI